MKLAQKKLIHRHTDPGEENQHKGKQKEKEGGGKKKVELPKGSASHMRKLTTQFLHVVVQSTCISLIALSMLFTGRARCQ